jgi:hypothetical protein
VSHDPWDHFPTGTLTLVDRLDMWRERLTLCPQCSLNAEEHGWSAEIAEISSQSEHTHAANTSRNGSEQREREDAKHGGSTDG